MFQFSSILPEENIGLLDLAAFPALTHIELHVTDICDVLAILPALHNLDNTNAIETITFQVDAFDADDVNAEVEGHLTAFYAAVKRLPLPALWTLPPPASRKLPAVFLPEKWDDDPNVQAMLERAMSSAQAVH